MLGRRHALQLLTAIYIRTPKFFANTYFVKGRGVQTRSPGGRHSGAVPPIFLLCHPKFCCAQKNLFQTYSKSKNLAPLKMHCAPPNLEIWPRAWGVRAASVLCRTLHPVGRFEHGKAVSQAEGGNVRSATAVSGVAKQRPSS